MIRASVQDDIPSLIALAESIDIFPAEHLEILEEMLTDFFESPDEQDRFWLTDEDDDEGIVGMIYCEPEQMTSGTWNLRLIAVAPDLQDMGRGGLLLEFLEDHLRQKMGRLLLVDTSGTEDFESVRNFYSKYGFREEALIRNFYEEGDDKITLSKRL